MHLHKQTLTFKEFRTWIKKNPTRTVSYLMNGEFKVTPFIRLQGKWLDELGFKVGSKFSAEIKEGKILLKIGEYNGK